MNALEKLIDEQGTQIAIGMVLGIAFLIYLVVMIAMGDRKPPDKKDGP
jgi:hypothetical protein